MQPASFVAERDQLIERLLCQIVQHFQHKEVRFDPSKIPHIQLDSLHELVNAAYFYGAEIFPHHESGTQT